VRDYEQYKHEIPVIFVDGREIARHRLTEDDLDGAIRALEHVAVVVMARLPEPGRVKTRLTPELSPEQAAAVYKTFLCHLACRLGGMGWGDLIVCHDPPDCFERMRDLIGREAIARYEPQCEGDLGARLAAAAKVKVRNAQCVMFLGTDSPDVPAASLHRVAELLSDNDVVIAPTDDGGFWAVALRPQVDANRLFEQIEWSSGRELEQTVARARTLGYNVALADHWDDVDRPADLRRLIERLRRSNDPSDRELLAKLQSIL